MDAIKFTAIGIRYRHFFLNETDGASGNDPKKGGSKGGDDPVVPIPQPK